MSTPTYTPTASGSGSHPPSRTTYLAPLVPILPSSNSTSNSNSSLPRARKPPLRASTSTNDGIEYHESTLKGSKGKGKAKASSGMSSSASNGVNHREGVVGRTAGGGTVCAVVDRWGGECLDLALGVKGGRVCKRHLEEGHLLTRELRSAFSFLFSLLCFFSGLEGEVVRLMCALHG